MADSFVVIACALTLINRSLTTVPPIELVERRPIEVSPQAEAFVRPGHDVIYLLTSTVALREAREAVPACSNREPLVKLASIFMHELWHVRHGPDERGAYEAQLTTLSWLGMAAHSPLYNEVRRSMREVLTAQKRHARRIAPNVR
jgi:hypothetical protein